MLSIKYNRKDYMAKKCSHHTYYKQFVTMPLIRLVESSIGVERIRNSKDPYFNDIPLIKWDRLSQCMSLYHRDILKILDKSNASTCAPSVKGGGVSDADRVCVLKAGARMIKEGEYETENSFP